MEKINRLARICAYAVVLLLCILPLVFASENQQSRVFIVVLEHTTESGAFTLEELYVKSGSPDSDVGPLPDAYKYEIHSFDNGVLASGHFLILNQLMMLPSLDTSSQEDLERYDISEEEVQQAQAFEAQFEEELSSSKGEDGHTHGEITHDHEGGDLSHEHYHEVNAHSVVTLEHSDVVIAAPYFENAQKIVILNPSGEEVHSINTVHLAQTCGNHVCEDHESVEDCALDCNSGAFDGFCDRKNDGVCDPDCKSSEDIDCSHEKSESQLEYEMQFICNNDKICDINEDKENCPSDCGVYDRWMKNSFIALALLLALLAFYLMGAVRRRGGSVE